MNESNRLLLLDYLKRHCRTTIGFEEAFARVPAVDLSALVYVIEARIPMHTRYQEYIDFLDGNGFSVEKINDNWYILTYVYEEESQ